LTVFLTPSAMAGALLISAARIDPPAPINAAITLESRRVNSDFGTVSVIGRSR
jgi:hypothetical protein